MRRIGQLVAIGSIAAVTVWFGLAYGPTPEVRADIYTNLASSYQSMVRLPSNVGAERNGLTLLNTNRVHYRVSFSRRSVHQVLDDYQDALTPKVFHFFPRRLFPASVNMAHSFPDLPLLEALVNRSRTIRVEQKQWGMFSFLDLGPEANQDWSRVFRKRMELMSKTRRLGDLGIAKTVVAFPSGTTGLTTSIAYWTDPDFDLAAFDPRSSGDLPGRDAQDLPRPASSRRLLTFDQTESGLSFLTVMYETSLSPEQAIETYTVAAAQSGWQAQPLKDEKGQTDPEKHVLFLKRGPIEAQLFAYRQKDQTQVLVNRRSVDGSGGS
jgi:hypothetical protein